MTWASGLLLLVLVLFPALSSWSARRYADAPEVLKQERIKFYLVSLVVQWTLVAACWWVVWLDGQPLAEIGLRLVGQVSTTVVLGLGVTAVLAAIVGLILWVQYTRWWPESPVLVAVLPETVREKTVFMALAATAGVCEEILYRGFAITRLALWTGGRRSAAAVAVIVFSAGHLYQGAIGVWRAGVLGAALAATFVITGSLIPGMIAHFLLDALAGLWGRAWLTKPLIEEPGRQEGSQRVNGSPGHPINGSMSQPVNGPMSQNP